MHARKLLVAFACRVNRFLLRLNFMLESRRSKIELKAIYYSEAGFKISFLREIINIANELRNPSFIQLVKLANTVPKIPSRRDTDSFLKLPSFLMRVISGKYYSCKYSNKVRASLSSGDRIFQEESLLTCK